MANTNSRPKCPPTPELDRMRTIRAESAVLARFVDWLDESEMRICERMNGALAFSGQDFQPVTESYERFFARFFEIDLDKVEAERRALLDYQRALNDCL